VSVSLTDLATDHTAPSELSRRPATAQRSDGDSRTRTDDLRGAIQAVVASHDEVVWAGRWAG